MRVLFPQEISVTVEVKGLKEDIILNQCVPQPQPNTLEATHSDLSLSLSLLLSPSLSPYLPLSVLSAALSLFLSFSLSFSLPLCPMLCCYLSLSLHLHHSSFSPRVQAVAKKQKEELVYVWDMLSFFFFFSSRCVEFRTFSIGNVINPFHPPQLHFTISADLSLSSASV